MNDHGAEETRSLGEPLEYLPVDAWIGCDVGRGNCLPLLPRLLQEAMPLQGDRECHEVRQEVFGDVVAGDRAKVGLVGVGQEGAYQCGYCTPGMILTAVELLSENANPTDAEILTRMQSHLCRCCGYPKILKAIRRAAGPARRQMP